MKLSIIVLTHNRLASLRECLIRLESQTEERDAEIIVVDNGSTDGTTAWLLEQAGHNHPIPIIPIALAHNKGVCERNHAIDAARGRYIAQVDDDVLVMSGWDRVLIEPMERDERIGATGQHGFYQEPSWGRTAWSAGLIDDRRRPAEGQFCDLVMGFCWAWRNICNSYGSAPERVCFRYDERLNPFWHEESDLQLQIRAAGYRILKVRPAANHRSLPHIRDQVNDIEIANRNFRLLREKWQGNPRVHYEGAAVGLR